MTPNEQAFIDAAIEWDCARHRYHLAGTALLKVAEIDKPVAAEILNDAARAADKASVVFHQAKKRVTDPHLPK